MDGKADVNASWQDRPRQPGATPPQTARATLASPAPTAGRARRARLARTRRCREQDRAAAAPRVQTCEKDGFVSMYDVMGSTGCG